jgi:hypothetical protein
MHIDEAVADLFLDHPKLSPTRKTRIVGAIAQMNVRGRQLFIERAILAADDQEAFQIQYWAETCAAYHTKVKPVATFVRVGTKKTPIMQRADGTLIVVAPLDYIAWTSRVAATMEAVERTLPKGKGTAGKELWLDGTASPMARPALVKLGWSVVESAGKKLGLY